MTLSKQLLAEDTRPAVIKDLVGVVQQEVGSKEGVSGAAIKAGYGAASRVVPNLTERALDKLLPDFLVALDPFWAVESTESWWEEWAKKCTYDWKWRDHVLRSLITLKALIFAPTGGIAAAATRHARRRR